MPPDYPKSDGKLICDNILYEDLKANCEGEFAGWMYWPEREQCFGVAEVYYWKVDESGGKSGQDPYPPVA